jgi:hypothetical protein
MPHDSPVLARQFGRLAEQLEEPPVKHILNESRFPRAGDAGYADQSAQRYSHVDPFEVVGGSAEDFDRQVITRRTSHPL